MTLLKRLLPTQDVDALLGDITEESRRRSRLWYWTQLLAVLVVGSWRDVRRHKGLALRATVTGVLTFPVFYVPAVVAMRLVRVLSGGGYYIGPYWLTLPADSQIVATFLFNLIAFALSGWVVTRFHRAHGLAMVLPYLMLVCLIPAAAIVRLITDVRGVHFAGSITYAGPSGLFVSAVMAILSLPVCVVAGAVLGLKRDLRR